MKTDREMAEAILHDVQTRRAAKQRRVAVRSAVVVVALAVTTVFAAQKAGLFPPHAGGELTKVALDVQQQPVLPAPGTSGAQQQAAQVPETSGDGAVATTNGAAQTTNGITTTAAPPMSSAAQQGQDGTTQGASDPDKSGGDEFGGPIGGVRIPALPTDRTIRYTGEAITDEEAAAYFKENTWLQSALASSGVDASGIRYAEHGYCHVSYDGTEGKPLEVRQNFRDYLVWNGSGGLIAIVTLTKENGTLSATPAFGGPWFDDYNAFLQRHRGEALVFVYAGWMELVLTPDEGVFNPQGTDASEYLKGVENPYEVFRCDAAAYTP